MPEITPSERRALTLATVLAVMGGIARLGLGPGPEAWSWRPVAAAGEGDGRLDSVRSAVERSLEGARRAARPLASGERLDPNRADAVELQRLPGVGPVTARSLVRHRRRHGPFADREALLRVRGIGPRTLSRIASHLSLPSRPPAPAGRLDLNRATEEELRDLPGIGAGLARAIVRSRRRDGPFRSVDGLARVPGVGPIRVERIRSRVRAGPP